MEKAENLSIKVCIRVRPLSVDEISKGCANVLSVDAETKSITISNEKQLVFDEIFSENDNQKEIYEKSTKKLINLVFEGYNATVFAYGQTGSGKTFTMGNTDTDWSNDASMGIIPSTVDDIFEKARVEASESQKFIVIYMSYLEIYNEDVRDLLQSDGRGGPKSLAIRENKDEEVFVSGLAKYRVESKEHVQTLLAQGNGCRATATTNMNKHSSRSHAICSLYVYVKPLDTSANDTTSLSNIIFDTGQGIGICSSFSDITTKQLIGCTISKFHLVDLAGSERNKKTGAEGQTFKEGVNINLGLLALGNVISVLSEAQQSSSTDSPFVPYRDSKLTRMLQDSLGGNARTVMITCVSPSDYNYDETCNSLRYSARARNIKNNAVVNRMKGTNAKQMEMELVNLRQEVKLLQIKLMHNQMMNNPGGISGQLLNNVRSPIDKLMTIIKTQSKTTQHYKSQASNWQKWGEDCQRLLTSLSLSSIIESENILRDISSILDEFSELQKSAEESIMMNASDEAIPDNMEEDESDGFLLCETGERCEELSDFGSGRLSHESSNAGSECGDSSILRELGLISSEIEDKEIEATRQDEEAKRLMIDMNQTVDRLQSEVCLLQSEKESLLRKLSEKKQILADNNQASGRSKRSNREQEQDTASCERTQERLVLLENKIKELVNAQRMEREGSIRARSKAEEEARKLRIDAEEAKEKRANLQKKLHEDAIKREQEKQTQLRSSQTQTKQITKLHSDISRLKDSYQKQENVLKRQLEAAVSANKQLKVKQGLINRTAIERAKRGIELTSSSNPASAGTILAMKRQSELHAWLEKEIEVACAVSSANKVIEKLKEDEEIQTAKCADIRSKLHQFEANSQEKRVLIESLDRAEEEISRIVDSIACMQSQLVELQDQPSSGRRGVDAIGSSEMNHGYQYQMADRWKNVKSMTESRGVLSWMFDKIIDSQESDYKRKLVEVQVERDMMKERIKLLSKELNQLKSAKPVSAAQQNAKESQAMPAKSSNEKLFLKSSSFDEGRRDMESLKAKIELIESIPSLQPSRSMININTTVDEQTELADEEESDESYSEESDSEYDPNESDYQLQYNPKKSKKRRSDDTESSCTRKKSRNRKNVTQVKQVETRSSDSSLSLSQSIQFSCQDDDDEPVLEESSPIHTVSTTLQPADQLNSIWDDEVVPFVSQASKIEQTVENHENKSDTGTFLVPKVVSGLARYLLPTKSSVLKNSKKT